MTNQKVYFDGTFLLNKSGVGRDSRNLLLAAREAFGSSVQIVYPRIRFITRTVKNESKPSYSKSQKLLRIRSILTKKPEQILIESNSIFIQPHLHCISLIPDPSVTHIVRLHDVFPITHPEWFQYYSRTLFKIGFKSSIARAWLICDSLTTYKELMKLQSFRTERGVIAHCPVLIPESEICSTCEGCRLSQAKLPHAISVSTLEPRKNYSELLNSWIRGEIYASTGTHLFIIGGRGWKSRKVRGAIAKYGESHGVRWIRGACDGSVQRLLKESKLFISTSLSEGFNLSVAEAILQNIPTIISDNEVHLELYQTYSLFYESGNPVDLTLKIKGFLGGLDCSITNMSQGIDLFDYQKQINFLAKTLKDCSISHDN
jgi:glycosyltransferase involved in cell wall biosynthesis